MRNSIANLNKLYQCYTETLQLRSKEVKSWDASYWTTFVKCVWSELGENKGFTVYYSGHVKEHMFDLCWIKEPDKVNKGRWMQLALESEWHISTNTDLLVDFHKLLDAKAFQKVYIFQTSANRVEEHIALLADEVSRNPITLVEELYLLIPHIDLERNDSSFTLRIQGFVITTSGNIKKLSSPKDLKFI